MSHAKLFAIRARSFAIIGGLIVAIVAGLVMAYQRPLHVPLNIGLEEGINNDLPFVRGFNANEKLPNTNIRYRWSKPDSALVFEGVAQRPYILQLQQVDGASPTISIGSNQIQGLHAGRRIVLFVPAQADATLTIGLHSQPWQPPTNDPRSLGFSLSGGSLAGFGTATPPLQPLLAWLMVLGSIALLVGALGGTINEAMWLITLTGLGAITATWFAPVRVGASATTLMLTVVYALGFAVIMRWCLPYLLRRLHIVANPGALRWLILLTVAVFAIKLWGRMLPASMPGDIGFHHNRVLFAAHSELYIPSEHRDIPFPYPPVLYVLLLPFTALGISIDWAIQLAVVLCEAVSVPWLFIAVKRISNNERAALWSGGLYGLFAADFMTVAWMFGAHIFVQFVTLVWSVLLMCWWGRWHERRIWLVLATGLLIAALGHFGFYINSSLLVGILVVWLWLRRERQQAYALLAMAILVQCVAWGVFYSAFLDLFVQQSHAMASGGINAVNNRPAIDRLALINDTLRIGFWWHYALVPVLLAPLGLWRIKTQHRGAFRVIAGTWAVSIALGLFPIINSTTITTRWLMFSAWAIAITTGTAFDWIWQRWRWGKYAVLLAAGVVVIWGLVVWFGAMVYRIRPPEPF